jgi:hypothetical protein
MKEVASILRLAYLDLLNPIQIGYTNIPVFDERVPSGASLPEFMGATAAYVIIRDQLERDITDNKCNFKQDASITLDIITRFPKGLGGKVAAETIAGAIQEIINPFSGIAPDLGSEFQLLKVKKDFSQTIIEEPQNETLYRKVLIYVNTIFEK